MVEEAYVNFKVAKLLNEKGFIIDSSQDYWKIGQDGTMYFMCSIGSYTDNPNDKLSFYRPKESYPCPTQQMAMRWLREKYNIYISIQPDFPSDKDYNMCWCWSASILHENCISLKGCQCYIETYEEAIDSAIEYVLENLI